MQYTFEQYCSDLDFLQPLLEQDLLNESLAEFIGGIKGKVGKILNYVKNTFVEIGDDLKSAGAEIIKAFKDKSIFAILKAFGFSLGKMLSSIEKATGLIHKGVYKTFEELHRTAVFKAVAKGTKKIDEVLNQYPILKKITGPAVAGLLVLTWLNMTFVGNFDYDMDITSWFEAAIGNFNLYEYFASPRGMTMLAFLATGVLSGGALSVAWLGSTNANLAAAVSYAALKKVRASPDLLNRLQQKIQRKTIKEHRMKSFREYYLTEELKLSPGNKKIIKAFIDKKPADDKKFQSTGEKLDGLWIGGNEIAFWKDGQIQFGPIASRSRQTVVNYIRKTAPSLDLYKEDFSVEEIQESIMQMIALKEMTLEEANELFEGDVLVESKLHNILSKAGLHLGKSKGLIQYVLSFGKGIGQLVVAAIRGDKEKIKSLMDSVTKEDVIDFLLKLDQATLHLVTGPIHLIDSITGWHLWAAVKSTAEKAGDVIVKIKQAIDIVKQGITKAFDIAKQKRALTHIQGIETELAIA